MTAVDAAPDLATLDAKVAELVSANDEAQAQLDAFTAMVSDLGGAIGDFTAMAAQLAKAIDELRHTQANRRQAERTILDIIDRLKRPKKHNDGAP
jgi:chromosome segregation ATPase